MSTSTMARMSPIGRPRMSPTTCASTVRWPCPCGTEAVLTVTVPIGSTVIVPTACAPFLGPALARWSGVKTVVI